MSDFRSPKESEFEKEVIEYLTKIGGVKQWEYLENVKTTEALWLNFKTIIEQNNRARLDGKLSDNEFSQVKRIINAIQTPYQAGQFLYGTNGVSEIEIDLDNGKHVFLTIFDQAQVGGGNTVYQIVNQIYRPKIIDGKKDRQFDVTLLINGLPIIQLELKKGGHSSNEALNQMEQYIAERQYSDIFSTLQILVAMTPYDIRYMANTTRDKFNKAFAFNWQNEEDSTPVTRWREFADKVLSIPMAHDLATRYMVLDGTKNRESIKVMRPYQVYATKRVIESVRKHYFNYGNGKLGYIWHTTGSGKTITSFKTAWLASRLPNVDKVIFLVDRVALTNQTADAYRAYDPQSSREGKTGVVGDTANISDLHKKLTKKSDKNIIVTSIQKMSRYVTRASFKPLKDNILFIVDEAHRSTGDGKDSKGMLEQIRKAIPSAAWIGYTGTPRFPETYEIFGSLLHAYTIKEAIADKNVLGFNVEFKETIKTPDDAENGYLNDELKGSIYDNSPEHIDLVVKDIFENWKKRSNDGKYNALLTVRVGGNRASTPRAMEYFDKFEEYNQKLPEEKKLKVGISFSLDTSNKDSQLATNESLERAIYHYNDLFQTDFSPATVKLYTEDLARRLNRSAEDRKYLDLVIVIDQLLTGFDAPELNTLYIDRTLKGGNLIQAYSRTNRMHKLVDKPWGNIINYRWPEQNKKAMHKAFYLYSNRDSATIQQDIDSVDSEMKQANSNISGGIIARPFKAVKEDLKEAIGELRALTKNFVMISPSDRENEKIVTLLKDYTVLLTQLKQYSVDENDNPISAYDEDPSAFYEHIGLNEDEEVCLTTHITEKIKEWIKLKKAEDDKPLPEIDFDMVHVHHIKIDYDYLNELIGQLADEVHADEMEKAKVTKDSIDLEIVKSVNEKERGKMTNFVDKIYNKEFVFDYYPAPRDNDSIQKAMEQVHRESNFKLITKFIGKWGLDFITPKDVEALIRNHQVGNEEDLEKKNELNDIMNQAKDVYQAIADEDIASLKWLSYRTQLRKAFYQLADTIKKAE